MTDQTASYDAILAALARELARVAARDIERTTTAHKEMADVKQDEQQTARDVQRTSRDERELFRAALNDCRAKGGEVTYDSADPEQDARAGVLARYLVRLDYAEALTEEPEPGRYLYRIRVFWNRLRDLAAREGLPP